MAADGLTKSEIARRLGVNWRTAAKLVDASAPPSYARVPAGSMLDPLEPVLRRLVAEWPEIRAPRVTEILRDDHGYTGSVDLVRKRLALLRPRSERAAQRTGYRPGQVLQVDWAEMPTRPRIAGRERRVYALVCSLQADRPPSRERAAMAPLPASRPSSAERATFSVAAARAATAESSEGCGFSAPVVARPVGGPSRRRM
jgi:transposase